MLSSEFFFFNILPQLSSDFFFLSLSQAFALGSIWLMVIAFEICIVNEKERKYLNLDGNS